MPFSFSVVASRRADVEGRKTKGFGGEGVPDVAMFSRSANLNCTFHFWILWMPVRTPLDNAALHPVHKYSRTQACIGSDSFKKARKDTFHRSNLTVFLIYIEYYLAWI